ncbi:hypothetical protein [Metamycoplasma canadense]|uniref:Uncharacterized protein n=1 Tax=Metamycoplasma canadense TaxID=29554 RepID=A0A077L688_9BACT|nr:hypothetical protein [Metamycoplasma canadense]BAP39336.1 hypothetical protein MCAN360_0034 [Metamycoplasma canadense]
MKKIKNYLFKIMSLSSFIVPLSIISSKCENKNPKIETPNEITHNESQKPVPNQTKDNELGNQNKQNEKEKLKNEDLKNQLNELAEKVNIKPKEGINSIEQALKIDNYTYDSFSDSKITLLITKINKKDSNNVILTFKLINTKENISSSEMQRQINFNFSSKNNILSNNEIELNGLKIIGFKNIVSSLKLNKNMTVTEAINKLKEHENKKDFKIYNLKFDEYDETKGTISISFSYEIENNKFDNNKTSISGFKKVEIFNKDLISISLNKEKLIKEKKNIKDLNNQNLNEYLIITTINSSGEEINISKLIENQSFNYKYEYKPKFSNEQKKENVNLTIIISYKKKDLNKAEEEVIQKIELLRKSIKNNNIKEKEILDYIIDNSITTIAHNLSNKFPSAFLKPFNDSKKIAYFFIKNDNENYFGTGEKIIQFSDESLKVDDFEGKLKFSFNLKYQNEGKTFISKSKEIEINNLKKITSDYLSNFQLIFNSTSEKFKTITNKMKDDYLKNQNLDSKKYIALLTNTTNNEHIFLRNNKDIQNNELEIRELPNLKLNALGKPIKEVIKDGVIINFSGNEDDNFEINYLFANFKNVEIDRIEENRVYFKLNYDLVISINSDNNSEIVIPQSTSWFFNI